jgi:microcystin-dependent protein
VADTKISDMVDATTITSAYFKIIQGGTNKKLPAALITDYVDDAIAAIPAPATASIPVGGLLDYAGATEPTGWLFCYGQAVSRTTYADLFTALSTVYGSGDGSTTFNVPDLRGRVSAGQDDMGGTSANRLTNQSGGVEGDTLGSSGGAETHTLTIAQLAAHTHSDFYIAGGAAGGGGLESGTFSSPASTTTGSAGSGAAHNNVQPTLILNKIIYTGV